MTLFVLQVGLILVAAFLAGCAAGCWSSGAVRRARANALDRLDALGEEARQRPSGAISTGKGGRAGRAATRPASKPAGKSARQGQAARK